MKCLDRLLLLILQTLMTSIVVVVSWQVISRYVLASPSSFTEELARILLIWISILGTSYAYRHNAHLGLDMVYQRANEANKQRIFNFVHGCVLLFSGAVLCLGGAALVKMTNTLGQTSAVMGIDMGLVYSVIPLTGVLMCIFAINAIAHFDEYRQKDNT